MKIELPEKRYYGIGEVAKAFSVNNSLIRFWEKEFDIIKPKKNAKGDRKFTSEDIKNLELIYHLVKERGFTLEGAKTHLKENKHNSFIPGRVGKIQHKSKVLWKMWKRKRNKRKSCKTWTFQSIKNSS